MAKRQAICPLASASLSLLVAASFCGIGNTARTVKQQSPHRVLPEKQMGNKTFPWPVETLDAKFFLQNLNSDD
jgi:hypothetical protein